MENKTEAGRVNKEELKKRLTPLQYQVTQEAATERPFSGEALNILFTCTLYNIYIFINQFIFCRLL